MHTLVETTCLLLSYVRHSHKTIIDIEYEMLYAKTSYSPLLDRDCLTYKRHPILLTVLSIGQTQSRMFVESETLASRTTKHRASY